jgi:hypothetical protein
MKTKILIILMAVLVAACSNDKKDLGGGNGGTPQWTPTTTLYPAPPSGTTTPPVYVSGASTSLTIPDMRVFEQYTGRIPNSPSEFKIHIDLRDVDPSVSRAVYGGTIHIGYKELTSSGSYIYPTPGTFVSGNTPTEAMYNKFVTQGGATLFKGFFEDVAGGLIIVADSIDDLGIWSGKVFFKNFQCNRGPYDPPCNPVKPKRCWFISIGPYDCASFKTGNLITNPSSTLYGSWEIKTDIRTYPEDYTLLGSFQNLDSQKALNITP